MSSMSEVVTHNHEVLKLYGNRFQKVFGVSLNRFWSPLLGFDLLSFDKQFIHSHEDESMSDAVLKGYGQAGVDLIESMLRL